MGGIGWFWYHTLKSGVSDTGPFKRGLKGVAWFLLILSVLFYFLWLVELVPAVLQNDTPKTVSDPQLLTNPVHVLDLSFIWPSFIPQCGPDFSKRNAGLFIGYPLLAFTVLMSLTISGLGAALLIRNTGEAGWCLSGCYTALMGIILPLRPSASLNKRVGPI